MARRKSTTKPVLADEIPVTETITDAMSNVVGNQVAAEPQAADVEAAARLPAKPSAPHASISVNLSGYCGGPSMHLLRSHKFNQMQVRFDGQQPDEQYLVMLAQAGWKDRSETDGVWTKQIDRAARWQSVQQMEREFRDVANAIRRDRGLSPALEGMARA